jgi:class 3 adenylate cyclase
MYGARARFMWAPDFPLGTTPERLQDYVTSVTRSWGDDSPDTPLRHTLMPTLVHDPVERQWWARFNRSAASPGVVRKLLELYAQIDLRHVLPAIQAPVLVVAREGDKLTVPANSEVVADLVPNATLRTVPGDDTFLPVGDVAVIADEIEEFLTGSRGHDVDDRVLATVLCTDIVASTERLAAVGDRRWRELLDEHDRLLAQLVRDFRGQLVASTGDGVLATFDGPARAIRCAHAARDALATLGIEIRCGIHTGEIERRGDHVAGLTVHVAVRVQAAATAGDVLVSRTVVDLVTGSGLTFSTRGKHELKGVPGDWELFVAER